MEHTQLLLLLACTFGFFMAWGIGANDVANAMGTSVGSQALSVKNAIIIAAIFEAAGAIFAGGEVTQTIRGQIIDFSFVDDQPLLLVYGMLASLLAAGTWLLIASIKGWPVSTTHSIIGAIIGFGCFQFGTTAIHWEAVTQIVLSWVATPIIAGVISFFVFQSIQYFILRTETPFVNAKKYVPVYVFLVTFVIGTVTFFKGLKHVGIDLLAWQIYVLVASLSLLTTFLACWLLSKTHFSDKPADARYNFVGVEKIFGTLMIFMAAAMAFAHGSNDVANAIGPLAAIVNLLDHGTDIQKDIPLPSWTLLLGAIGIIVGLATYGYRVIATIGKHITELTPSRGFAANLATASTVVIASGTGLPVSATQTLVGAILGVGLARGISALNLHVIRNIFLSWIITLPIGALLAIVFFYCLRALL